MWKSLVFIGLIAIWGMACGNSTRRAQSSETAATSAAGDGKHFGDKITEKGAIAYDELLTKMENTDSLHVKVMGKAGGVCQVKGCWMDIVPNAADKASMRVRFKDYGFFVPKDITGRTVVVDGYALRSVTSVEDLRHYAEDAGKSKEEIMKITEPKEEIKFMASGVLLLEE